MESSKVTNMGVTERELDDLTRVVKKLQQIMSKYGSDLYKSEYLTRYVLIDPLLRALGWDTEDPTKVWVDYRLTKGRKRKVDYALFHKDKVIAFIEAEHYGTLSTKEGIQNTVEQLITYCNTCGVKLGMLSDGGCWLVYDVFKPVPFEDKVLVEIDFAWAPSKVSRESLKLSPNYIGRLLQVLDG